MINEIDSTLTTFAYDQSAGTLDELQTLSTLPPDCTVPNTCADVHVAPSGRHVYGSNRGHDSIAIFDMDERTGMLTLSGHEPTQGRTPRSFALDASGTVMLAANQDSDSIVSFHIDKETGQLSPTGYATTVSMPVCVKIVSLD